MRYYSIKLLSGSLKGENMKKINWLLSSLGIIFLVALLSACHFQEKFIFVPTTLPKNYSFHFDDAFEELNTVSKVIIPDSVKSVGAFAFYSCKNLKEVDIGKNVKNIG